MSRQKDAGLDLDSVGHKRGLLVIRPEPYSSRKNVVLDFCRFGDGAVLRKQLDQLGGSVNRLNKRTSR